MRGNGNHDVLMEGWRGGGGADVANIADGQGIVCYWALLGNHWVLLGVIGCSWVLWALWVLLLRPHRVGWGEVGWRGGGVICSGVRGGGEGATHCCLPVPLHTEPYCEQRMAVRMVYASFVMHHLSCILCCPHLCAAHAGLRAQGHPLQHLDMTEAQQEGWVEYFDDQHLST